MSRYSSDPPNQIRVRARDVEWIAERLTARDGAIVAAVNRLRVATSQQLERLLFADLPPGRSRTVVRSRVLKRLVDWQVLARLPRRVGGGARGSAAQVVALGVAGQRLLSERQYSNGETPRVRRPGAPGERTLRHMLAVAELNVRLVELGRDRGFTVVDFQAEPASWWPNGYGGFLKPDAYVLLEYESVREHAWIEVDMATESLTTLRRKLLVYLDFLRRGQQGPGGVVPRVVVSTVSEARRDAVAELAGELPPPAAELFAALYSDDSPLYLSDVLAA